MLATGQTYEFQPSTGMQQVLFSWTLRCSFSLLWNPAPALFLLLFSFFFVFWWAGGGPKTMQRFFSFLFFLVSIFGVNLWQMDSLLRILCPNGASTITDRRQPANSLEIFGFGFGGGSIFLLLDLRNHMRRKPASLPFFFFFFFTWNPRGFSWVFGRLICCVLG